jgi:circadian clock protein KaiB
MTEDKELPGQTWESPDNEEPFYKLRLFITGASPNSIRAVNNTRRVCEQYLKGRYELEIIDVYQQAELIKSEQIVALPMLKKDHPFPQKRLIGDMSDLEKVLKGLGLE